ncbi:VWA domain-containing protein [Nitrospina watsonii]|uniref:VWFA domain-containing protein n=1 Tax=Nitrospina watsonii TaxID=1323948 RepID=A0ABM9HEV4_9BACT|nr:VWA domain-containing protein [Nitrospina watsonii]CAI2718770.1 VWFA domain-containing protein [Nitrospina watsonii]
MKRMISILLCILFFYGCAEHASNSRGVYLLLDTSGTYTKELKKAQQIINFLLGTLGPGDTIAVARIDSASFSEKDIVAKVTFDSRPSVANAQKRKFAEIINDFVDQVKGSQYTDITGGLFQAIEYLNEVQASDKHILIYSDLKEELPEGYNRNLNFTLDGFHVRALNVTKLRADNVNPEEYVDRLKVWKQKVETGGGQWQVINDLDREDALVLS